jgi:hypothetical protein
MMFLTEDMTMKLSRRSVYIIISGILYEAAGSTLALVKHGQRTTAQLGVRVTEVKQVVQYTPKIPLLPSNVTSNPPVCIAQHQDPHAWLYITALVSPPSTSQTTLPFPPRIFIRAHIGGRNHLHPIQAYRKIRSKFKNDECSDIVRRTSSAEAPSFASVVY